MKTFSFSQDGLTAHVRNAYPIRDGSLMTAIDFMRADELLLTHRFNITDAIQRVAVAEELSRMTNLDQAGLESDLRRLEQELSRDGAGGDHDWPPLSEVPEQPLAPRLPASMVPEVLRPWLVDVAQRTCFPLEFVAVPAIVGAGAVIGRAVGIMPARYDDFLVVPNLWGGIVGRPGLMKSFAVEEGIGPVSRLAARARERFKAEAEAATARGAWLEAELAAVKSKMVAAAKKGGSDGASLEQEYVGIKDEIGRTTPVERRYITHDATIETFDRLLSENPRGMLVLRDELAGWLRTMDKPGREGDREFFLEAWNGTSAFTRDRIGRGTVHIAAVALSIVGGIQPSKLLPYIKDCLSGGHNDDGLLQRLQLLVWPDDPGPWIAPTGWPDRISRARAAKAFEALDRIDDLVRPVTEVNDRGIPYLRFQPEAQELFDNWRLNLERRLRSKELATTPAFESHIAKYRSLMPSMALIFHLLDIVDGAKPGDVSLGAAALAADWCEFLELHARKVYAAELTPGVDAAHLLAAKLMAGALTDGQSVRDVTQHHWSGLTSAAAVHEGLQVLEESGWVRIQQVDTGGRPSEVVRLHPDLVAKAHA